MSAAAPAALALALVLGGCFNRAEVRPVDVSGPVETPAAFDHSDLTRLLARHVDAAGLVDYPALVADSAALDGYLQRLARTSPARLDSSAQLAFWLNAYNAYTLKLVADHYPTRSLLRVVSGPFIPSVNSPFSIPFVRIGGRTMTLDAIEHGTIRAGWREPRIHFALVCAARSCPPLRREAYEGARLDAQLDSQARAFLADATKNRIDGETAELSKIFDWFKDDFGGTDDAVQRFIAPYFAGATRARLESASFRVRHLDYDWTLNDQAPPR